VSERRHAEILGGNRNPLIWSQIVTTFGEAVFLRSQMATLKCGWRAEHPAYHFIEHDPGSDFSTEGRSRPVSAAGGPRPGVHAGSAAPPRPLPGNSAATAAELPGRRGLRLTAAKPALEGRAYYRFAETPVNGRTETATRCPGGANENRPAIHRWVGRRNGSGSPVGTIDVRPAPRFSRPSGTAGVSCGRLPSNELLGYSRPSLRDLEARHVAGAGR
jgi:hypothetical protein